MLVVDTANFLPGFLNFPVPHSDKLHVVERFSLDPQTMKLTRSYTVEDPVNLKGQGKGQDIVELADAPYTARRLQGAAVRGLLEGDLVAVVRALR